MERLVRASRASAATGAGNIIIAGSFDGQLEGGKSTVSAKPQSYVTQRSPNGSLLWSLVIAGEGPVLQRIATAPNGTISLIAKHQHDVAVLNTTWPATASSKLIRIVLDSSSSVTCGQSMTATAPITVGGYARLVDGSWLLGLRSDGVVDFGAGQLGPTVGAVYAARFTP